MRQYWKYAMSNGVHLRYTDHDNDADLMVFLDYDEISLEEALSTATIENPIYPYWMLEPEDEIEASEVHEDGSETIWTAGRIALHSADRKLYEEV